jgi:hypothetical protein
MDLEERAREAASERRLESERKQEDWERQTVAWTRTELAKLLSVDREAVRIQKVDPPHVAGGWWGPVIRARVDDLYFQACQNGDKLHASVLVLCAYEEYQACGDAVPVHVESLADIGDALEAEVLCSEHSEVKQG